MGYMASSEKLAGKLSVRMNFIEEYVSAVISGLGDVNSLYIINKRPAYAAKLSKRLKND